MPQPPCTKSNGSHGQTVGHKALSLNSFQNQTLQRCDLRKPDRLLGFIITLQRPNRLFIKWVKYNK